MRVEQQISELAKAYRKDEEATIKIAKLLQDISALLVKYEYIYIDPEFYSPKAEELINQWASNNKSKLMSKGRAINKYCINKKLDPIFPDLDELDMLMFYYRLIMNEVFENKISQMPAATAVCPRCGRRTGNKIGHKVSRETLYHCSSCKGNFGNEFPERIRNIRLKSSNASVSSNIGFCRKDDGYRCYMTLQNTGNVKYEERPMNVIMSIFQSEWDSLIYGLTKYVFLPDWKDSYITSSETKNNWEVMIVYESGNTRKIKWNKEPPYLNRLIEMLNYYELRKECLVHRGEMIAVLDKDKKLVEYTRTLEVSKWYAENIKKLKKQ
jgi:hypothetical protein